MTDTRFTPGPWVAVGTVVLVADGSEDRPLVAYMDDHRNKRPTPREEKEANAALTAAAPDMYAALTELASCVDGPAYSHDRYEIARDQARTALRKARGET